MTVAQDEGKEGRHYNYIKMNNKKVTVRGGRDYFGGKILIDKLYLIYI